MMEYVCDFEIAQNSNHSESLKVLLEKSITCQNSAMAHFFSSKILRWLNFEEKLNSMQNHMHILSCDKYASMTF